VSSPDYISSIVGYRVWQWDAIGLKSLNDEQWIPGEALQAKCRARVTLADEAPGDRCSCGVYAAKDSDELATPNMACTAKSTCGALR
jgi:hypothetical protein